MDSIDNNQFEVKAINSKRKLTPSTNVYLNPALDLLANEDPMCNTAMEIVPNKKRKQMKTNIAAFENTALDLGISKEAVNEFLVRELNNVRRNCKFGDTETIDETVIASIDSNKTCQSNDVIDDTNENIDNTEPIYANISTADTKSCVTDCVQSNPSQTMYDENVIANYTEGSEMDSGISILEKHVNPDTAADISNITKIETNITNHIFINNPNNVSLSFIDRLTLDSPNVSNQSLYLDDDLNESNIMEIKTITVITKKRQTSQKMNTNPFLDPNLNIDYDPGVKQNPFLELPEPEYSVEAMNRPVETQIPHISNIVPRQLFTGDTNSTISTVNESSMNGESNEYENIDGYRSESPVYENVIEDDIAFDKQSKILGCDVSRFTAADIMNLNKFSGQANSSNDSNDSRKDLKNIFKVGKLSKKVFKTLKKTFKTDKPEHNVTLNPYEVPRKPPKQKASPKDAGIENPGLNLDNSDEIEVEEVYDEEHEYETIKTIRNTRLNANVTPLRERTNEIQDVSQNKVHTPGKKVRFDSTLNQEKVITGDSFDYDVQSPGFDAKIDKYHDELENCINERKILQQNM
ncbi:hypothetical protein O3G_MSEX002624 [Manduca sexta]|uniref:Uncharacterized protein n=1 Tax=Manduca sexta TaxID=7130 RepID=A0A922CDL6_MANSE|nr:hypothetical protein O3G_MSEX002624 [Manduca sexta]KAG6443031.1 hypothetical protein O3G_MSEX002624 [Manduca sexta]